MSELFTGAFEFRFFTYCQNVGLVPLKTAIPVPTAVRVIALNSVVYFRWPMVFQFHLTTNLTMDLLVDLLHYSSPNAMTKIKSQTNLTIFRLTSRTPAYIVEMFSGKCGTN